MTESFQGYFFKFKFKYFETHLFHVTTIVLLVVEMNGYKVLFPKGPRVLQDIFQSPNKYNPIDPCESYYCSGSRNVQLLDIKKKKIIGLRGF